VREILDHVQPAFAPNGRDASDIESAVEQVLPMRGRAHQRFIRARSARSVGDVLARAIHLQRADLGNSL